VHIYHCFELKVHILSETWEETLRFNPQTRLKPGGKRARP